MDANALALILFGLVSLFVAFMAYLSVRGYYAERKVQREQAERHARYLAGRR